MNADKQLSRILDKKFEALEEEVNWLKLHKSMLPAVCKMNGPLSLYLYMRWWINRSAEEGTWVNLDQYYKNGFLPFAQHQRYIAKAFDVTQQTVSNWLKVLITEKFIYQIGTETVTRKNDGKVFPITVYSLGEWQQREQNGVPKTKEAYHIETLRRE